MERILIVDDETQIRDLIKKYAKFAGFLYDDACNGLEAVNKVTKDKQEYDLIVMDIMMPELDGFSAIKEIRKFSDVPVIMLSARGEEYDKLYGFDLGIDDYVTKPFSPKELMMRITAVLNRYHKKEKVNQEELIKYGDLVIDLNAHLVTIKNERIELTPKEFELLVYFLSNPNVVITRQQLMEKIWGINENSNERTLDTHIKSLRKKIHPYDNDLVTLRRVGYRFEKK